MTTIIALAWYGGRTDAHETQAIALYVAFLVALCVVAGIVWMLERKGK